MNAPSIASLDHLLSYYLNNIELLSSFTDSLIFLYVVKISTQPYFTSTPLCDTPQSFAV